MKIDNVLKIRRSILALEPGASATINLQGEDLNDVLAEAKNFVKSRKLLCAFEMDGRGLRVTRVAGGSGSNLYPEIDALEVGGSKLFELPPALHQRIRLAASNRSRSTGVRLSCTRDGDFIRVTRLPVTDDDEAACGAIQLPARATKYDMERLANGERLTFSLERRDHHKLRLAAHRHAVKTGWTIRCRIQDDGTMLVYRADLPTTVIATPNP